MSNEEAQRERDELLERVRKAEQIANESQAEAAVYRKLLEDLYRAADQSIKHENLNLLHEITRRLAFFDVPSERDVKEWGKLFLRAYVRDAGWLGLAKNEMSSVLTNEKREEWKKLPAPSPEQHQLLRDALDREAERIALAHAVCGKYAFVLTSSDAFAASKTEEIALEDRSR